MALPVFPGAVGFGTHTVAGRGGRILRVTNLNDDGPGSLRAAMTASGRRAVIFEVSGIIDLKTTLCAGEPYLTVAGQTAPSPGIMVRGAPIVLYGHDVLVQHIASRPGCTYPPGEVINNRDAFCVSSDPRTECYNIVLDHVSGSWSTDEVVSTWADDTGVVRDVTISNSIFAEALTNAGHTDEETGAPEAHSTGVLIGRNSRRISLLRNVMAYNRWRNPLCRDDYTDVQVVNNLIYLSDPYELNRLDAEPSQFAALRVPLLRNRADVEMHLLADAGARPRGRDRVDARIVRQIRRRTGSFIDHPNEVGGYPAWKPLYRRLTTPRDPNGDDDRDGYTNLEEWLHRYAAAVERGTRFGSRTPRAYQPPARASLPSSR